MYPKNHCIVWIFIKFTVNFGILCRSEGGNERVLRGRPGEKKREREEVGEESFFLIGTLICL